MLRILLAVIRGKDTVHNVGPGASTSYNGLYDREGSAPKGYLFQASGMNGKGFHLCVKGVPFMIINDYNDNNNNNNFLIGGIQKEYLFCQKWYIKG